MSLHENKRCSALILEGGAMRGMFTSGILDVLMEEDINVDALIGVSAGAVFGCNYKSRQIGRAIRYNKRFSRDPRYYGVRSFLKTGDLFGAEFCYHLLPQELDYFDTDTFEKNPVRFYILATDVDTGRPVVHLCTDGGETDLQWMRASASMPMVSHVVEVDGYRMLDGGIVDPVPYAYMEELGYNRNIIILTQAKGYRKKKSSLVPAVSILLRKTPEVAKAMQTRHLVYNEQMDEVDRREASGEALVIRPPEPLGIGRIEKDPKELERVYMTGREEAKRRLQEIREFLQ